MYNRKWGQDRRRFQRLNLNLVVWYKFLRPQPANMLGAEQREAITIDISPFGMAFMSSYNMPVYSDLALKFIIFSSQDGSYSNLTIPIEVNAKVRSCTPGEKGEFRVGVSFTNIQLEQQQKLMKFAQESLRPFV
ncbi:MAG TPA: PilZ domain-containing protein [Candidatus Omnitrophota bacterium]|nr:PilZ domain-containing protein [Candidatus Omnitrophota bacterium]